MAAVLSPPAPPVAGIPEAPEEMPNEPASPASTVAPSAEDRTEENTADEICWAPAEPAFGAAAGSKRCCSEAMRAVTAWIPGSIDWIIGADGVGMRVRRDESSTLVGPGRSVTARQSVLADGRREHVHGDRRAARPVEDPVEPCGLDLGRVTLAEAPHRRRQR